MSEKQFSLEIVTPSKMAFSGQVTSAVLPGVEGELGILAGHAALLAILNPGITRYVANGKTQQLVTGAGFVEVCDNKAVVVVDLAESAAEISVAANSSDEVALTDPIRRRQVELLDKARKKLTTKV